MNSSYCPCVSDERPCVRIAQGIVKGTVNDCEYGTYISFKGIPYAKPPIGALRFKAPEPPTAWEGELDASQHGPVCPQYNERMNRFEEGSEDCLYLNVYTKNLIPSRPLPVMVWIHGGAFYTGSGNSDFYGPDFFMGTDVVLVTFNYRLEVLGFLCLDNEEVPGNAGLKDQVAALQWVKKNISAFGGNSYNITIFGCSAGSVSVTLHLISKMSEGLFNKAICQSGVCLNDWSYGMYGRERAFQLGKLLGKETEDDKELLQFLKCVPVKSIVKICLPLLRNEQKDLGYDIFFGPVVEKSKLSTLNFLNEPPPDSVRKGQIANVPIILGFTSGEGMELAKDLESKVGVFGEPGILVPRELKLRDPGKINDNDKKIRQHYFEGKDITKSMVQEVSTYLTDFLFAFNIVRFAGYCVAVNTLSPVYLYTFTAESERNYTKKLFKMDLIKGVCHAEDLHYLFQVSCLPIPISEESKVIMIRFVKLWTDFARTGNPTTSDEMEPWKPFVEPERYCYIIGSNFKCSTIPIAENFTFWEQLYKESDSD